ncbi:hypothetical protein BH09VER1_BH09VER1_28520 [soil metagenome]
MNAQSRENLRTAILIALEKSKPYDVTLDALSMGVLPYGFRGLSKEDLQSEVQYLVDLGFARKAVKSISPEIGQWHITAPGRDHLAEKGLA